jgi:hypothetical protein
VTTENTEITSALDSDQAQLDAVQEAPGSPPAPADPLTEEFRALREEVVGYNRQVAGLQSKVDRGLNAIRDDTEKAQRQQQDLAIQRYLEQVPEEHRPAFQAMAQRTRQLEDHIGQMQYQGPPQEQQAATQSSEWEQIYAIPRSMGIDPQTPGIDYEAFTEPGLTEEQRRDRFFVSIKGVMAGGNSNPSTQTAAPQNPPREEVQSPPSGGTPAGGVSGSLRSIEQIENAYIENKLSFDEYKKRLAEAGQR